LESRSVIFRLCNLRAGAMMNGDAALSLCYGADAQRPLWVDPRFDRTRADDRFRHYFAIGMGLSQGLNSTQPGSSRLSPR
jgi:hypothetical protein